MARLPTRPPRASRVDRVQWSVRSLFVIRISSGRLVPASIHTLGYVPFVSRPVRILTTPGDDTLLTPNEHRIGPQGANSYFTMALTGCINCASLN